MRSWSRSHVILLGGVVVLVLLAGTAALAATYAHAPACGCGGNPDVFADGIVTSVDATTPAFTLRTGVGDVLHFVLTPQSRDRLAVVQDAFQRGAVVNVAYPRVAPAPYPADDVSLRDAPVQGKP